MFLSTVSLYLDLEHFTKFHHRNDMMTQYLNSAVANESNYKYNIFGEFSLYLGISPSGMDKMVKFITSLLQLFLFHLFAYFHRNLWSNIDVSNETTKTKCLEYRESTHCECLRMCDFP